MCLQSYTLGYSIMKFEFVPQKDKGREGESLALLQIWNLILGYLLGLIDVDKQIAF